MCIIYIYIYMYTSIQYIMCMSIYVIYIYIHMYTYYGLCILFLWGPFWANLGADSALDSRGEYLCLSSVLAANMSCGFRWWAETACPEPVFEAVHPSRAVMCHNQLNTSPETSETLVQLGGEAVHFWVHVCWFNTTGVGWQPTIQPDSAFPGTLCK